MVTQRASSSSTLFGTSPAATSNDCPTHSASICGSEQAWILSISFPLLCTDIRNCVLRPTPGCTWLFGQPYSGNDQLNNFVPQFWDPAKAPAISAKGTLCPAGSSPSGIENRFSSNYHSLQTQFQKRWGSSSLFVFNYTWSHNLIDNPSDRSNAPQNTYDIAAEYGPSSLDRRHNITASYVYDLPWFKAQHGFTGHALGGWEVSGLVYYYTGTPLTVTTSNTDAGGLGLLGASASSARPDMISNPNDGAQHTVASFFNMAAFVATPLDAVVPATLAVAL